MSRPIRVALADDHAAIRMGLRLILETAPDIEVVGEAEDGQSAIELARALRPDVILMDIRMPGLDGIRATRAIVEEQASDVLVLTTFDLDEYVFEALRAGAVGFLLKTVEPAELIDAVRRVAAGDGVLAPEVTRALLGAFAAAPTPVAGSAATATAVAEASIDPRIEPLTERERDVLTELGRGLSNQQIARALFITEATAKTHVSRVLGKLGCRSRMQAAVIAREAGLAA
ncbi:response regulator [Microterricola pindariensis]|uniref:DNA-binding response regulator n=1 Tax=Microterricola pindariensis TaxID=478010 RepID=A0ABX5AUU2_9MICO|nr:response regulator transcription factor [Microterricola pindariensis]PPL17060.1 DNA-binding response regulator [Microterricola pindariensis]